MIKVEICISTINSYIIIEWTYEAVKVKMSK